MGKKLVYYIDNRSIKISFILYALISLVVGITISVTAIALVDNYRINLNYKYEDMTTRYDIPENGSFIAKYNNDQTEYTIYNASQKKVCSFIVDYQKERPVQEYVYPNHVSYIEVSPNFTKQDRIIDTTLGMINIATIPVILSFSMMLCVTIFIKRKLARPIKLLTNAYSKIENKELDFTLYYPYKDEMGKLCLAFEKINRYQGQNNRQDGGNGSRRFDGNRDGQNRDNQNRDNQGGRRFDNNRNGMNRDNRDRDGRENNGRRNERRDSRPAMDSMDLGLARKPVRDVKNKEKDKEKEREREEKKTQDRRNGQGSNRPNQGRFQKSRLPKALQKPARPQPKEEKKEVVKEITLPEKMTIRELAEKMKMQPAVIVKKLFMEGTMVTVNHEIDFEKAQEIAVVCVESLNMKSMSNKKFGNGKSTMDNGYGMFLKMLEYKFADRKKYFVKVDKWFPSSQICNGCGKVHSEMKNLNNRIMKCDCGLIIGRDQNAAINIKKEGLRILKSVS